MSKWVQRNPNNKIKGSSIVDKLISIRGIKNKSLFMNPDEGEEHPWEEMDNVHEASLRILDAIQNGEKIAISNDCGYCSQ